jgi:hypothetical protein
VKQTVFSVSCTSEEQKVEADPHSVRSRIDVQLKSNLCFLTQHKAISDQGCLLAELDVLERIFREKGYSTKQIQWGS